MERNLKGIRNVECLTEVNPYVADEAEQGFILYNKMKPLWEARRMEYSETVPMLRFKVG